MAPVSVEDKELMLKELSDEDDPDDDDFKTGDEFDVELVTTATVEPSDQNKKTAWHVLSKWNHYHVHLTHHLA